jgi:bacterioferritin (cytochrome b1)
MTPDQTVVAALQTSVSLHLQAIEHYQALAEHFDRWGYPKLGDKYRADVDEERGHLHKVMERLEFYDVQPTYEHASPAWPRHDLPGILDANLLLETTAATAERSNVLASRAAGDERSAIVFAKLLKGSEASIEEITAAQQVIEQIGLDNYLATFV